MQYRRQGDAEQAAERAQGAAGGGGRDDHREHGGVIQEVLELGAVAGGPVADFADQPGPGSRQGEQRGGVHRVGGGRAALARRVRAREAAGGEVGQQGLEAAVGAVEPGPDRGGPGAQDAEMGGDDQGDGRKYGVKASC